MLKSMLTARQLGIEEWERDALIRVRDDLESGKIPAELMREAERLDDAAWESRKAVPAPRYVDPNQQELSF